jgi:hypothetical protein
MLMMALMSVGAGSVAADTPEKPDTCHVHVGGATLTDIAWAAIMTKFSGGAAFMFPVFQPPEKHCSLPAV